MRKNYVPGLHVVSTGTILILLTLACWVGWSEAQEKIIELTYASPLGEKVLQSEQARIWAREVEKRTNGRVKVTRWVYSGGICGSVEQLGCLARGLADLGHIASSFYPSELRLATLTEAIFTSNVPGADVKSRIELYETFPAFREEFRAAGVEIVSFPSTSTGIIGTSKRKPINSSSDLKGLKAQSYGPAGDAYIAIGMTPVSMTMAEVYEAMSRGVIDGWWAVFWYITPSKLYEVSSTVIDPGVGTYAALGIGMNKNKYDSLPKDIQKIIEDVRRDEVVPDLKALETAEDETVAFLKKSVPDMRYVRFSDKLRETWMEKVKVGDMYEKLLKEREGRSPQARAFFKKYLDLVKKYEPEMKSYYKSPFDKLDTKVID